MQIFYYKQSQVDHTLFIKHSSRRKVMVLIVYVDYIVVIGDDKEEIQNLKKSLADEFEIKDLGSLSISLVIKVARSKDGILSPNENVFLTFSNKQGCLDVKPLIIQQRLILSWVKNRKRPSGR
jgi:hypothetical protein